MKLHAVSFRGIFPRYE